MAERRAREVERADEPAFVERIGQWRAHQPGAEAAKLEVAPEVQAAMTAV